MGLLEPEFRGQIENSPLEVKAESDWLTVDFWVIKYMKSQHRVLYANSILVSSGAKIIYKV